MKIFSRKFLICFLFFAQNIDCGYTLEPPQLDCGYTSEPLCLGGSNEYPQSMFWSKHKKTRYTRVLLYKSGVQGDILIMDMFS